MKIEHESGISAECIAASVYDQGVPIYTLVTRSPKYLDAEFEKHRMLSSNSSSSRAIPASKMIEQVEINPWVPFDWRKAQKGMQGYEQLSEDAAATAREDWLHARDTAVDCALSMLQENVHKQHINRVLEPWSFQNKVITGTEWANFFALRCHPTADPAMQALANCIREAIAKTVPVDRTDGSWHLPFILEDERKTYLNKDNCMVSGARVARISYSNHGTGKINRESDLVLADTLNVSKHLTPFEAQARKLRASDRDIFFRDDAHWSANFRGWHQFRKELE